MKKSTLALALLFAALFSYVWFVERKHSLVEGTGDKKKVKIFEVGAPDIHAVKITKNRERILLQRNGPNTWEMKSPIEDWADADQCNDLANTLAGLTTLTFIPKKENVAAYGLGGSQSTYLEVTPKLGSPIALRLGGQDPTRSGVYAYLPDEGHQAQGELALVPLSLGQVVNRPVDAWRDHAIIHFARENLKKIEIKAKGQTLGLEKSETNWNVASPAKAKADENKVAELLSRLSVARLISFAPETSTSKTPLKPLEMSLQLWESGNQPPKAILFGARSPQGVISETAGRSARFFAPYVLLQQIHTDASWYIEKPKASK